MGNNGAATGQELTALIWLLLFLFGFGYAFLVDWIQRQTQSFTAFLVVAGVLVTVLASGFVVGWSDAEKVLIMFSASGFWMVVFSIYRVIQDHVQARKATLEDELEKLGKDAN